MKKVKILRLSIILSILLIGSFALSQKEPLLNNFKPGSEPDGFRGIKWGTNISTLKDMILKEEDPNGLLKIYGRKGDTLEIGGAKLKSISYCFWQGKLFDVLIQTEDFGGEELKNVCFEKFGRGAKMRRSLGVGPSQDNDIQVDSPQKKPFSCLRSPFSRSKLAS